MIIRCRDGLRMVIIQPRAEGTDDKIISFKSLVGWRRLVNPASYRFKVMDTECKGITASIPSNHIKRMMPVMYTVKDTLLFRFYKEITSFIFRFCIYGRPHVPLTEG